ncbi:MAG TPA: hypothetical protein PLK08_08680 [Phycisphaerae bacterium]|nr:hypothetical protein [Phycisphaerae bacterium]
MVAIIPAAFAPKDAAAYLGITLSKFYAEVMPSLEEMQLKPVFYGYSQRAMWPRDVLDEYVRRCPSRPRTKKGVENEA